MQIHKNFSALKKSVKTTTLIIFTLIFSYSGFTIAETPPDSGTATAVNLPTETNNPNDAATNIKRSQFTTAIVNREPTDNVVTLTNNSDKIYFFTELANLKGHTITHRWEYQGKLMAEIKFDVHSDRWRIYSSKNIKPAWTGEWTVELIDENGTSLDAENLQIVEAKSD